MDYLSDGIAETITNQLSQIASLRVVPHSMACRLKGTVIEPARLGKELDVRLLLAGHVVQQGENLVVGAELIDAVREAQLWGKTFNRRLDDIFLIQDEIGQEISNHLHFRLTDAEKSNLSKRGTDNREAYLLRTKALYWAHQWAPEALQKSFRCIQQAIDVDPTYAEAYADLGYMFAVLGMLEYAPPSEMFPRAQAAARKALEIDDSVADAHAVLAFTQMVFDWDFASAENEARRAIELAPRLCGGYYVYSQWCLTQCRFEEAIAAARRTVELDPLTLFKSFHLGATYLYARRYGDAIEHLKQTLDIDPSFWMIHIILALAQARIGNHEEAIAAAGRCADDTARKTVVGMVEAISGKRDDARAISRELMKEQSVSPRMRYRLAGIHAELGDLDAAFESLGKALDGRTGQIVFLAADPSFDNLRADPRWLDLVRRVGLVST
jgi:TolB-like protein